MSQERYSILLAPNPSMMTGPGTNTLLLSGSEGAIVIDPGDPDQKHLERIVREGQARGGIRHILITHGHPDHVGGAAELRERIGVPISAFSRAGVPLADHEIPDGATFDLGDTTLRAIHTPGHRFDHLCFWLEREGVLFAGDVVAGTGTVVIIPPEGHMGVYLQTLKRLQQLPIARIVPAHGPVIEDPQAKLSDYIAHRLERERQIIDALNQFGHPATLIGLVRLVYTDTDPKLYAMAARSLEAHLIKLQEEGRVQVDAQQHWSLLPSR